MAKVRVHEIAKDLGITSKDMVDILLNMGLDVKNHMSTLEESQANWVKKQLKEKSAGKGEKGTKRDSAGAPESKARAPETGIKSRQQPQPASKTDRPVKGEPTRTERPVAGGGRTPGKPAAKPQRDDRRPAGAGRTEQDRRPSDKARQDRRSPEKTMQPAQRDQGRFKNNDRQVGERKPKPQPLGEKRVESGKRPAPSQQRQVQPQRDKNLPVDKRNTDTAKAKDNRSAKPPGKFDKSKGPKKTGPAVIHRDYSRPGRKQKHKRKKEEVLVQLPEQISIEDSIDRKSVV